MRIFVTGASGFIGSFVCRALAAAGHEVAALSRDPSPWRLRDIPGALSIVRGDLEGSAAWVDAIRTFAPDAVAHVAWRGVAGGDRNAVEQVDNIGWTAQLVERAHGAGARVFLGLGSQAEHGPRSAVIGPSDATEPTTLYGEAKLAAGRIAAKLAAAHGMRFVWMRVFSTYGPTDHPHWMIPSLIRSLLRRQRPALTPGDQSWDFLHVADAARAIGLALESPRAEGVYALGSGHAPSLRSTIEMIRDEVDPRLPLGFGDVPYRPDQVMRLQADVTRLRRDLDWAPEIGLRAGLAETVAWYRANPWVFEGAGA